MGAGNHFSHGLANGYRSGLESRIARELQARGIDGQFEKVKIRYMVPEKGHVYTVDFLLPNGIHIESKGRFLSKDRKKHLLVKTQHPEIDLRFVFTNPLAKISKASSTTYADWCTKNGFKFAKTSVPEEWINEEAT